MANKYIRTWIYTSQSSTTGSPRGEGCQTGKDTRIGLGWPGIRIYPSHLWILVPVRTCANERLPSILFILTIVFVDYLRANGLYNDAVPEQPSLIAYPSSAWVAPRNRWPLQDSPSSLYVSEAAFIEASDADTDDILFSGEGDSDDDDPPYAERMIVTTP